MTHDGVLHRSLATPVSAGRRAGQRARRLPDPGRAPAAYYRWRKPVLRWGLDALRQRER